MSAPVVPAPGGLAEALNILLDKGLVIDATIRVSVIGIEILTIEAKIVIASVDTYIRYLEAMHRVEMTRRSGTIPPPGTQGIAGTFGLLPAIPVAVPPPVQPPSVQTERVSEEER
ncbi:gas vesicle protein GvpJ [Kibdelosporangium aridum]|uniref:gas vesicle protein GvpJ n=1 Tax=Kibdelosporangium aridum TaxID=2030 RepID=UPI0035EB8EC1